MCREMSNVRAFCFRAPACTNQGRLGYAVTKNTPGSEVYHMSDSCSPRTSKVSWQEVLFYTPPPLSGCGRNTDTVHFPWLPLLLARRSNPSFPGKLGNRRATLTINNKEKGLSKFDWKTTSVELLLSSLTPVCWARGHRKGQVTLT